MTLKMPSVKSLPFYLGHYLLDFMYAYNFSAFSQNSIELFVRTMSGFIWEITNAAFYVINGKIAEYRQCNV